MEAAYFIGFDLAHCYFRGLLLKTLMVPYVVSYLQAFVMAALVATQGVSTIHYSFGDLRMLLHLLVFAMAALHTLGTAFAVS